MRIAVVATAPAAAAIVGTASPAGAATNLGTTSPPDETCAPMGASLTFPQVQSSAGTQYSAPSPGVITKWTFQATAGPQATLKLKMVRPAGVNTFTVVGDSVPQTPTASTFNTYDTRIPVQAGDIMALTVLDEGPCAVTVGSTGTAGTIEGDPPPGSTAPSVATNSGHVAIGASLEADADGDGFGDETQDLCPTNPGSQADCAAPETTIGKSTKKSRNGKAKFTFSANEPGATFKCKLKGPGLKKGLKKLKACASPKKYKGLPAGRFTFSVVSKDAAGNADATPAKKKFTVVD